MGSRRIDSCLSLLPLRLPRPIGFCNRAQDTNLLQKDIVYALAPPDSERLFVVGDAKQSIYRFRQAQVSNFNQVARDILEFTGHRAVPLDRSFRTQSSLVAAQNALFDEVLQPVAGAHQDFEARPGALEAHRTAQDAERPAVELLLLPAKDESDEKISADVKSGMKSPLFRGLKRPLISGKNVRWTGGGGCFRIR